MAALLAFGTPRLSFAEGPDDESHESLEDMLSEPTSADDDAAIQAEIFEGSEAAEEAKRKEVLLHVDLTRDDPKRGVVKLGKFIGETAAVSLTAVVVTTHYEELCTLPCDVVVDNSERPMFFFARDGQFATNAFRLPVQHEELTLKVKPSRSGMLFAGAVTLVFLVGIPLLVVGYPKVSFAPGPPTPGQKFKKLRRARR